MHFLIKIGQMLRLSAKVLYFKRYGRVIVISVTLLLRFAIEALKETNENTSDIRFYICTTCKTSITWRTSFAFTLQHEIPLRVVYKDFRYHSPLENSASISIGNTLSCRIAFSRRFLSHVEKSLRGDSGKGMIENALNAQRMS